MAYKSIESILEESVLSALRSNGIDNVPDIGSEDFKTSQRHVFLRDAVYYQVLDEFSYNPSFAARVGYSYDPVTDTTTYDQDYVDKIIRDYVRDRMITEIGRMEVDAQKKILENALNGKNILEEVREVITPGSKSFRKLSGAKAGKGNETAYRGALLDYIYTGTDKSFETAVENADKLRGKDDRPKESPATGPVTPLRRAGQDIRSVTLDVLESKPKAATTNSPYMSEALKIKKEYEDDAVIKAQKERIKEARKNRLTMGVAYADSEIQDAMNIIRDRTFVSPSAPGLGTFAERMQAEADRQQSRLVDTLPAGRGPIGVISPVTEYQVFGGGYGSASHDVWEIDPEARIKLVEAQTKRNRHSGNRFLTDFYDSQIARYTRRVMTSSGRSREAIGYKFTATGDLEVTDRLQERYDRAVKNFSKGLYKLDVPTELNKFRLEVSQINKQHIDEIYLRLSERVAAGAVLSAEEIDLMNRLGILSQKFEAHGDALSILEGMRFVKEGEKLAFGRLKKRFLDNIDSFETDPVRKAQIIAAIRSNNYLALRALITSGSGGTSTDVKTDLLYKEFKELAEKAGKIDPSYQDFLKLANKITIDQALVKTFVLRRHAENAIYAVQLMTNPKYLKSEIKVQFQKEVFRRAGNALRVPYETYLSNNPVFGGLVNSFYNVISDPDFIKDPGKYLKTKGLGIVKTEINKWVTKTEFYKNYAVQVIGGVEVELNIVEFIFDPKGFISKIAKDIAWTNINKFLNDSLRRAIDGSFKRYLALKRITLRALNKFKRRALVYAANFATKYMGRLGAIIAQRLLALAAGIAIPGIGWIVTAVLVVLPMLLRPLIGDKDLTQLFKDFIKFILLGPCLLIFAIYFIILLPIITLFANFWENLWSVLTGGSIKDFFDDPKYEDAMLRDRRFGGKNGTYGSYNLGDEMVSGLVNTSGNKCFDSTYGFPAYGASAIKNWNNLKPADFQNITGPSEINCRIMCNAQKAMATLYPGIKSDSGLSLLNCSSTVSGQVRFNPELPYGHELQRYWCTYTVMDSYVDDFPDISDSANSSVSALDAWFKRKIVSGAPIQRIDPGQLSNTCFNREWLMSGAAIIMSSSANCSLSGGNHAAIFLKFEGNKLVYINSNSGVLKETVEVEDCGSNFVKLKPKVYQLRDGKLILNFCSFYQIDPRRYDITGKSCPTNCVPDINNY